MLPGPGAFPTFLYYFAFTALLATIVLNKGMNLPASTGISYTVGITSGLIAGLLGSYFNRTIQITITTTRSAAIEVNAVLETLGYEKIDQDIEGYVVYERKRLSKLFSSRVFVQIEGVTAKIAGRASMVKRLEKQLQPPS